MRSDMSLLFRGLLFAYVVIVGMLAGEILADMLRVAWLAGALSIGGFAFTIWYILRDLRRVFRSREARRARMAEACGMRAGDLL